jgi:CRP-like cAMP-binding protein
MWKRGPGADDTDKGKSLKRLFFKSEAYKRRYFVLDSVKLELKYYADYSRGTELGCIDLLSVVSVSYDDLPGKDFPYKFPWCLTTDFRDWVLCCENEEEFKSWKREMSNILKRRENGTTSDATMSKNERNGMCLEAPPLTIQRSVMDEADYKGNAQHSQSGKSLFRKSNTANNASKGKLNSFSFKRRSCVHNSSFRSDALLLQRARLGEESVYNSYTGNVGIAATATFSKFDVLDKLEFFQVLMSSCHDDVDVLARHQLVTKFLGECQFEFYTEEGEILIEEGRKFEWIYFVLEGEIGQRKTWASDTNRIDEKISVGECAGFVEALHFNSISSKTLLVGPGTICLKMSVASFRKQFLLQFKDKAKFSSAMEPTSTLYMERMLTFTHKCLTHLPLLQRQPVANIQALSHIFEPVFIASGDHLMDAGESSNMFYIVIEGSCSVFQKSTLDADEVDEIVRSCRAGDWVGEAGLINIQSRHITVVANSDVIALCTNAAGFKRFMDITGPSVREAITQSTTTYLSGMLKTIPLFLNVDESQIMDISREIEIRELERDAMLCDAGERLDDLYIILHGYVQCAISAVSGLDLSENPPFIDSMRENDFFGESAVLYDNPPVSRLQYLTPPDVKVVVLCIPATKIKTFLPSCPILRLRFEERLLVRKNHIDLIDTLVNSIAISMSARYDNRLSGRSRSKQSLGHMADMKAKEASYMNDEVLYLREEVKRLNGVQYVDTLKSRSQSRALSTFKSTIRRIKSSLPISAPQSKAPEIGLKSKKKSVRLLATEAAFELAGNQVFRDEEGSAMSSNSSLYSTQTADVIKLE